MKTKFYTNRLRTCLLAICIAVFFAALLCIPAFTAYGTYTGTSGAMTREQIHTATLAASVSGDSPAITVFTHGLGGKAGDWSNDKVYTGETGPKDFVEDSESIIEKMRATSDGIQLFRTDIIDEVSFDLYPEYKLDYNIKTNPQDDRISQIADFSLHTVIVLDFDTTWTSLENLYNRLHNVIDRISYNYFSVTGRLPRLNLVGHSMGGLVNMQYVIEHPKNVDTLVSLGTPYKGSSYDNPIVAIMNKSFLEQRCITGTCKHEYYFCNLTSRKNKWNEVYEQNKHIRFYALGGKTSPEFMNYLVKYNLYLEKYLEPWQALLVRTAMKNWSINWIVNHLPGDICVDLLSQKATGYKGVINYTKIFSPLNSNLEKRGRHEIPIPHNLETYDADMHSCILNLIDYRRKDIPSDKYETQHGIKTQIISKSVNKWLILLTNETGSARSFEYNQRMCSEADAHNWTGLGHIASTDVLPNGASTIIEIEEFGTASDITISYDIGETRYIFYAHDLKADSRTMTSVGNIKNYYSQTQNNIKVGIVSKYFGTWSFKLTNNTGKAQSFYYNTRMCYHDDAKNWTGLSDVAITETLENGESTVLQITEYGTATDIVITYTNNGTRYIFYADNLNTSGTMISYGNTRPFYTYTRNRTDVSIIGKCGGKWLIQLTNNTGSARNFEYNQKMCYDGDAKNWTGLSNVVSTLSIANGASYIIEIEEYLAANSIAISYNVGNTRNIFYAYNLNVSGTMSPFGSTATVYKYNQHNMTVGIVGKNGGTWKIKLTNNTGSARSFYYNKKMCNFGDAQNWTGLSDIAQTEVIANGASVEFEITENGTATSIAISYISGETRYIFYADDLNVAGTLKDYGNTKKYNNYTQHGIQVSIAGKNGGTWLIELTNKTGSDRTFQYNRKMCNDGDAKNWTNLSHVSDITLNNEMSTSLLISENYAANSIAISYKVGEIRYVFYAFNLDKSGTMTDNSNRIDPNNPPPSECIAEGTLITLADGRQVPVETLTGAEMLLVWNMRTGTFDSAPILFIDNDPLKTYDIINLYFSDETSVKVIYEHGFWDFDLNSYVYLDKNAEQYIGHWFNKQTTDPEGNFVWEKVQLTEVTFTQEYTTAWSPVTYSHLCYYVNGMLSMPGGISGLFNIFDVDAETMQYNEEAMFADIAEYGLFTYEDFEGLISEEVFDAVNAQYLKVAIGKGMLDWDTIISLISKYSELLPQ